jgi:hypothetical protein
MTAKGFHKRTRRVLDVDGYYNMATETLGCNKCNKRMPAWHAGILAQLDPGHRGQFQCILTRKLACDMRVVRLLRSRGLGNSSTQLYNQLLEQHEEAWAHKVNTYLANCEGFKTFAGHFLQLEFLPPPDRLPVPKYRWLMQIYCLEVLECLDQVKACITSVFGRVLKMDSTKTVVN